MRRAQGQASIEWIAIMAVVALVLGAAAALTYGGLGAKIAWAYRRGLCAVTSQRCPRAPADRADLPPCPLRRSSSSQDFEVSVAFVKLGGGLGVQEVTNSDGRVTVTFTNSGSGGAVAGVGASFQLGTLKAGAEAAAEASVKFTAGKSWTFPDRAAADEFVHKYGSDQKLVRHILDDARRLCFVCGLLGIGKAPTPPPADETYLEGGLHLTLGAAATALWGGDLSADLGAAIGHGDDRTTGNHTAYLRLSDRSSGDVFAAAGFGATAGVTGLAQLTVDRHGKPLSLELELVTAHAVLSQAPAQQESGQSSAQLVKNLRGAGQVKELEADLDLTDPANAAAARRFVHDALHGGPAAIGPSAGDFMRWIDGHGMTTIRTFASKDAHGGGRATLALAAEAGGGYTHSSQKLRLTGVFTRLPGLGFLPRADCLVL